MLTTISAFKLPFANGPIMVTPSVMVSRRQISMQTLPKPQLRLQPRQPARTFFGLPPLIAYPVLGAGAFSAFRYKVADREKGQVLVRMTQSEEDGQKQVLVDSQGMVWPWQSHRIVDTGPNNYKLTLHVESTDGWELFVMGKFEIGTMGRPGSIQKYISFLEELEKTNTSMHDAVQTLLEDALNSVTAQMTLNEIEENEDHVRTQFVRAIQEKLDKNAMVMFKHEVNDFKYVLNRQMASAISKEFKDE